MTNKVVSVTSKNMDCLYKKYPLLCLPVVLDSELKTNEFLQAYHEHDRNCSTCNVSVTLREEFSQTNVILQYKLLAAILSAVCSVSQQS